MDETLKMENTNVHAMESANVRQYGFTYASILKNIFMGHDDCRFIAAIVSAETGGNSAPRCSAD